MKTILKATAVAVVMACHSIALAQEAAPALVYHPAPGEAYDAEAASKIEVYLSSLSPLLGDIELKSANATIRIPPTHYFLNAADARSVLEDAWGNPPDEEVIGMIFPAGLSPLDLGGWGASIHFNDDGYVSDKDANKINYDELLGDIQSSQTENNKWRAENGYEAMEVIGWAETPSYNPDTHKLYWAKELKFGEEESVNTLNYDIRVLGRKGTLVISFIATMDELSDIRQSAPAVLGMAQFETGSTYAEYQPDIDKKAAYGIAGLIGGAVIAKKTGLLVALLLFAKKFFVIILAGAAAAFGGIKRFFFGNR